MKSRAPAFKEIQIGEDINTKTHITGPAGKCRGPLEKPRSCRREIRVGRQQGALDAKGYHLIWALQEERV